MSSFIAERRNPSGSSKFKYLSRNFTSDHLDYPRYLANLGKLANLAPLSPFSGRGAGGEGYCFQASPLLTFRLA